MKLLLLAAGGLLVLVGMRYATGEGPQTNAGLADGVDPLTTGSISRASFATGSSNRYRVVVAGRDRGCFIVKGSMLADGTARVRISPQCDALSPAMAKIGLWRDNGEETVALTTPDGRTLFDLAAGDGVAYQSYRPAEPLVSLVAE